jgi:hypothetical protein
MDEILLLVRCRHERDAHIEGVGTVMRCRLFREANADEIMAGTGDVDELLNLMRWRGYEEGCMKLRH